VVVVLYCGFGELESVCWRGSGGVWELLRAEGGTMRDDVD